MVTQKKLIVRYIKDFGSITPMQAYEDLGITKLSTRISEMKKDGLRFEAETVKSKNRYGKSVSFSKYSMEETNNEQL